MKFTKRKTCIQCGDPLTNDYSQWIGFGSQCEKNIKPEHLKTYQERYKAYYDHIYPSKEKTNMKKEGKPLAKRVVERLFSPKTKEQKEQEKKEKRLKEKADYIANRLEKAGFEASKIGGSVRNRLHNEIHGEHLAIKDFDLTTNASYEEVVRLFGEENVQARGESFKVAVVKIDGEEFEVAQYRGDVYPEEGSTRPNEVYAVDSLKEDVQRRDFTINGIGEDRNGNIIDHVGGVDDIRNKIIRTIGDSNKRFAEDPLRPLRAFRFEAQLGYDIHPDTKEGIQKNIQRLQSVPYERVKEEMNKLLKAQYASKSLRTMREMGMFQATFDNTIEKKQAKIFGLLGNLRKDRFDHVLHHLDSLDKGKLSKSETYAVLYQHFTPEQIEAEMKDMRFLNNDDIERTVDLAKHKELISHPNEQQLLQVVKEIGDQKGMPYLQSLISSYEKVYHADFSSLQPLLHRPLFKSQLPYNGKDVLAEGAKRGLKPGKWVGEVLELARERAVLGKSYDLATVIGEYEAKK